eukprot:478514_1
MAVELTACFWWGWLSVVTAVLIGCYEIIEVDIDHANSEQYMMSLFMKLSITCTTAVFYWYISQALCKRTDSLNTHKLRASVMHNTRDTSLKYGIMTPDEHFTWTKHNHSQFLDSYGNNNGHYGAYTVLRTVDKYYLFQFKMHVQRLLSTLEQYIHNVHIPLTLLRRLLIVNIRDGLDELYDDHMVSANEARIVIYIDICNLLTLCTNACDIDTQLEEYLRQVLFIHFGGLSETKPPFSACIRIGRRTFTQSVKTTKWTDDRNHFRKDTDDILGINEVIMSEICRDDNVHCDGFVMEGLSSNWAVLCSDLSLLTPSTDDGVLNGTLRGFLIDIMNEMKENENRDQVEQKYGVIPKKIVYGKPLLAEMMKWKGAVIMSTSRLWMPIHTLYIDIEDAMLLKLVGNDTEHPVFKLEKSNDASGCGYRKIVFGKHDDCLENMAVFLKQNMKSHSVYVGSVFNQY